MQLRSNARWSLVVPTSMGVRMTPEAGQPVHMSDRFVMQVTSAETNVANIPAALGLPVKVLTNFVQDSPISAIIKSNLLSRHLQYEGIDVPQGGPWGFRHQFNIADSGYGARGPRVWNDRAGEVGRTLSVNDFDLDRIFGAEGVQILHLSGLIAALSPETSAFCLELARAAKKYGSAISFDLNHRATFWKGREAELHAAFAEIASEADILIGNEEDFQLCLGISGPDAGGSDLGNALADFASMIELIHNTYPNAQFIATTLREVISANRHLWGMLVWGEGSLHIAQQREIGVLDRIGGGDGSVGGMLYGILKGWNTEQCMQFGWATGALAASSLTDYATPVDEDQVWSIWKGNARVKR
jgi:2-dehydro-3-deoxygluconokinase